MPRGDFNLIPGFIRRFRPILMREVESEIQDTHDQMVRNWERGADAHGRSWAPLAPSTVAGKGNTDPLIETREMIDSAGYSVDRSNMTAAIYVEDPKMIYHEEGTERIPARPVLQPAMEVFNENVNDAVGKGIDNAVNSAGTGGMAMKIFGSGKL